MPGEVLTISATKFKAECLAVLREVEGGTYAKVVVTRRGKPVAEVSKPKVGFDALWGAHRGSVKVAPGVDLTDPVLDEPLDAELGILLR